MGVLRWGVLGLGALVCVMQASHGEEDRTVQDAPLFAYVGTFSSPLGDVLPTQVDLPPGNGRGIHCFRVDRSTGGCESIGTFDLGTSPSSLVINASGTRMYSANETDRVGDEGQGTVSSYTIDRKTGLLTMLNTVPSGAAGPTYVSLHPGGRHLYAGNRLHDSIAVFAIASDGTLAYQGEEWSRGNYPRSFNLEPSTRFLFCCNQRSDNLAIFEIDEASGMPQFTGQFVPVGNPSCVVFLETAALTDRND